MELSSNTTGALAAINNERQIAADAHRSPAPRVPRKKRSAMHILRVALYMLRRKSGKSKTSIHVDVASKGPWKKVLGAIRPFHLQSHQSPTNFDIEAQAQAPAPVTPMIEHYEDVFSPKFIASPSTPCSSVDGMSQYASALNLQELDVCTEDEEENEDEDDMHYDEDGGDEMIDTKAEEFINNFYEQMRLQQREYMSRHSKFRPIS
ncbi:hypothetical protein Dsin_025528 [Dipteronia sinensis]|uniref:Cotton fiber protein n=1 Tax=Dipteronia sinensis TaxID=43782 RepID=A0AAD9ZXJ0_9ROSI|nr:hypothetical protein Dsin_025528 [Dipteronia sinensis]